MKYLLTLGFFALVVFCQAQNDDVKIEIEQAFTELTKKATPLLPIAEYYQEIGKNITITEEAKKVNANGKVYIEFIVEKNGKVSNLKVLKGIGYGCDEVALKAIKQAGDWNPAELDGKIVRQKLVLPIHFELADNTNDKF